MLLTSPSEGVETWETVALRRGRVPQKNNFNLVDMTAVGAVPAISEAHLQEKKQKTETKPKKLVVPIFGARGQSGKIKKLTPGKNPRHDGRRKK